MSLITASEARTYLPQTAGDDTLLGTLITEAEGMIARFCRYPRPSATTSPTMASTSYTLYADGCGRAFVRLPVAPITAVSAVYDDPDRAYGASTLLGSSDYSIVGERADTIELSASAGIFSGSSASPARRAVKVTCTAGFATADAELKACIGWMVKHLFEERRRGSKPQQMSPNGIHGEEERAASPGIPAALRKRLTPYVLTAGLVPV